MAIDAHAIAAKFGGIQAKTFYNQRAKLHSELAFPLPLNIPGKKLLWDEAEVDAWFAARRQSPAEPLAPEAGAARRGRRRKI